MENFLKNYTMSGNFLDIVKYPSPILTKKSVSIPEITPEIIELAKNMLYTMYKAPGVGLAAPQVGQNIKLFVIDVDFEKEKVTLADGTQETRYDNFNPEVFINPEIIEKDGEILDEEGCLSVPGVYEDVKRAETIKIRYQNLNGEIIEETVNDFRAIVIQHEYDHLDGVVFIERLSPIKKALLKKKLLKKIKIKTNE